MLPNECFNALEWLCFLFFWGAFDIHKTITINKASLPTIFHEWFDICYLHNVI